MSPLIVEYKSVCARREEVTATLRVWRLVRRVCRSRTHSYMGRSATGKAAPHDVEGQAG